jgi:hypothetical protein
MNHTEADRDMVRLALAADDSDADAAAGRVLRALRAARAGDRQPALKTRRRPVGRSLRLALAVAMVALVGNLLAARIAPDYAASLSNAPLVGAISRPVLRLAGLGSAEVTPATGLATSSGHTISLVGGAADTARTVVLVQVDGHDAPPSKTAAGYQLLDLALTDQYGHSYDRIGGQTGDLWFQPLVGQASHGPAHLTLHVTSLSLWAAGTPDQTAKEQTVQGDWSLGLSVTQKPGIAVPLPAPITVGDLTYTVTSIRVSGTEVTVDWTATGGQEIAGLYDSTPRGPRSAPRPDLSNHFFGYIQNADGSDAGVTGNSDNFGFSVVSAHVVKGTTQQVLPGPGTYVLAIGRPVVARFPITIPRS